MSIAGAALCLFAKTFSNSAWDHVGMVIRHPDTGELLFFEADFGGVKLRSLSERIKRSKSNEIAFRKLSTVRTDAQRRHAYEFACNMRETPYNTSPTWVVNRVSNQAIKQERVHYSAKYQERLSRRDQIDADLKNSVLSKTARSYLLNERKKVQVDISRIQKEIERLSQEALIALGRDGPTVECRESACVPVPMSDDALAGGALPTAVMYGEYAEDLSRVFCSELVAATYMRMGLLSSYPGAESFNPTDFSTENESALYLRQNASLSPEIFLRISDYRERQAKKNQGASGFSVFQNNKQYRGISDGDTPSKESRKVIREVLKRSPIGNTLSDQMRRSQFVKSFKAFILEPGEVVFSQGEYGDEFYVLESGSVDRFVGKGNEPPMRTNSLGPKSSFGTTGFMFNSARYATMRARERSLLWKVDRETYIALKDANSDPEILLAETDERNLRMILTKHFLFNRFDRLGKKEVNAFFPVKFRAGEVIFSQDEVGDNFYIIKSGEVERYIRHPKNSKNGDGDDDEVSLAKTLRSGQSFGELSLMYDAPRGGTARARTDVECFAISNEQYHKLNLGRGTEFLKVRFQKSASITRDGDKYMTPDDFLTKIANAEDFPEEDRARLSWLLISLVSNNRERDPVEVMRNRNISPGDDGDGNVILMNFWDFARMDIVLNHPAAEQLLAFHLTDQNNTGTISFEEMQYLLHVYEQIDESAEKLLSGESDAIKQAFGADGNRVLNADQFNELSNKILPKRFVQDVEELARHMRNVQINPLDDEDLRFVQDKSPSMLGSNFVSATSAPNTSSSKSSTKSSGLSGPEEDLPDSDPRVAKENSRQRNAVVSSVLSSMLARTAVAPLERLKILMQTDTTGKFRGILSGFRSMIREDTSIRKACFRGNANNVFRIVPHVLLNTAITQSLSREYSVRNEGRRTRSFETLFFAGAAGIITTAFLYPLEFARGRLSVQNAAFQPHASTWSVLRGSVAKDGLRSLYRGALPSMLGTFPYTGIPFFMYEAIRPVLPKQDNGMPSAASAIVSGAVVSTAAQTVALPLDCVRRRMQTAGFGNAEKIRSFAGTVAHMYTQGGARVFFRGFLPNLIKVAPATAVSFMVVEQSRHAFNTGMGNQESGLKWLRNVLAK